MVLTKEEMTINTTQRSLIRVASNELDSRKLGYGYSEPELVGDDIEDAELEPERQPLEVRADEIRRQGLLILTQEWDNEDGR